MGDKKIDLAIALLNKDLGKGTIGYLDSLYDELKVEVVSTGIPSLDWALGKGGIPLGKVIEISGPESGGKSFILQTIIASAQKQGILCALDDAEQALDPELAVSIGVDIKSLILTQEQLMENSLRIVEDLMNAGVKLVGVDSVAALIPKSEMEEDIGDMTMALQARVLSQSLRRIVKAASDNNATVIFINQLREKVGMVWGDPETTPGGRALKFYSHIRLKVSKMSKEENVRKIKEETYGHRIKIKVAKNKVAPPFRVTELDLYYQEGYKGKKIGIDIDLDISDFNARSKVIEEELNKKLSDKEETKKDK